MAQYIPCPGIVQAEIRGTLDGEKVENVTYWLLKSGAMTQPLIQNLADQLKLLWITNALPWLPATYAFREVYCTDLTTATSATATSPGGGAVGLRGNDAGVMPNNVTICVSFRTGKRGRSFRGRNYWCGIQKGDVLKNTLSQFAMENIIDVYNAFLAFQEAGTFDFWWVICSRYTNKLPRPFGIAERVTNVLIVDATIDTMTRRLPSRGQ